MKERHKVALVKASGGRPSGMYAWEWVDAHSDFEITVVVSEPSVYSYDDMLLKVVKLPMTDQRLSLGWVTGTRVLAKLNWPTIYLQGLAGYLRESDIVITVEDTSLYSLTCAMKKRNNRLVILTDESIQCPGYVRSWVKKRVRRFIRDKADAFFACSPMCKRVLIYDGIPADKIVVIPYATRADLFFPAPKSPGKLDLPERLASGFVVLFVGRVSLSKGIPWLLDAARTLLPALPDLYFVFAGPDDMKDGSFRAFLDEFPDRTFWLGVLGQGDLNPVYNLCDVLVLPSIPTPNWDEHCATVLYEALACGKPVIASHSGGSPYILAPEDSILVDFMSAETLASAISTLYHDRIRVAEMSASAFRHYQRSYSQEVVGKRIVQELERLVRG